MDTTQLLKGVLDVAVLAVITEEDGYGYDVVRRLRSSGLADVGDASVYGTLKRLYSAGALTSYVVPSDDGPHRKYYGINAQGRAMLSEQRDVWRRFSGTMSSLLEASGTTSSALGASGTRPAQPRQIGAARARGQVQKVEKPEKAEQLEHVARARVEEQKMWKIGDTL